MNQNLSKSQRRKLRELAQKAYEREIESHLRKLAKSFDDWKKEKMSVFQLDEVIHKYHNGDARESYKAYTSLDPKMFIIRAVMGGIIREEELPEEFRNSIMNTVKLLRE